MSHHVATLQSAFDKTASVLDFAYALAERLYWLDDNYVNPFIPGLRLGFVKPLSMASTGRSSPSLMSHSG
ncbi:MAG: hypothetical protein MH252_06180 [Thermosynechococcaceae cyanobacterium MS004]|nr:hypothetical protein [Thermosynechococcaceae cyanobacterium MS004]